jgi:hypothetical protein
MAESRAAREPRQQRQREALDVELGGRPVQRLTVKGAAAYEFGTRDTDHGIPMQPYPDG